LNQSLQRGQCSVDADLAAEEVQRLAQSFAERDLGSQPSRARALVMSGSGGLDRLGQGFKAQRAFGAGHFKDRLSALQDGELDGLRC